MLLLKDLITGVEYNSILVIIDRLTKYIILILYLKSSTAKDLAYAFYKEVVAHYGLPESILLDRDKLFTLRF